MCHSNTRHPCRNVFPGSRHCLARAGAGTNAADVGTERSWHMLVGIGAVEVEPLLCNKLKSSWCTTFVGSVVAACASGSLPGLRVLACSSGCDHYQLPIPSKSGYGPTWCATGG